MLRLIAPLLFVAASLPVTAQKAEPSKAWIAQSDVYTHMLLDVQLDHSPEGGSEEGLTKYDKLISDPTLADELKQRKELEAVLVKLKAQEAVEKDKNVAEDLAILRKAFDLQFRQQDFGKRTRCRSSMQARRSLAA